MKHKFHGQLCIYCGAQADTSDHAVREEVFLRGTARKSSAGSSLPSLQQPKI